jgi:hypothetical protein
MLVPWPVPSRAPPRSLTMTRAPSRANSSASARPMPPPAPVIAQTLPSSSHFGRALHKLGSLPAETQDGYRVRVTANIEFPGD